jgi:hypothetical protein
MKVVFALAETISSWAKYSVTDRIHDARTTCSQKIDANLVASGWRVQNRDGTVHWVIRKEGVLGLTVIGQDHRDFQIIANPPILTLDKLGMWTHLGMVLDGTGRVVHYVDGEKVSEKALKIAPPFRLGPSESGN